MKFHKNITLFCMFLFILSILHVRAENSTYSLVVNSNSNILNPDEQGELWIFVIGRGKISNAKVSIFFPYKLVKNGYIMGFKPSPICNISCCVGFNLDIENWIVHTSKNYILLNENYFKPMCNDINYLLSEHSMRILDTNRFYAPINIRFNISNNATPGDYSLKFIMSYQVGNDSYQDVDVETIHVTTYYERNEMILWKIGFTLALVALVLQFENIRRWIQNNFVIFIVFLLLIILVISIEILFLVFMVQS